MAGSENLKQTLKKIIFLIAFLNYITLFIIAPLNLKEEDKTDTTPKTTKKKLDLYKFVLQQQNINKTSITCPDGPETMREFFPKSFSDKHVLFRNFYLFNWSKSPTDFFDLKFGSLISPNDSVEISTFLKKLKFCTVNQFSKQFNASHISQLKFSIYSKQLNEEKKVQPGGYYRPPLCLQEFIYYHTNDATLMKLKLILDKYLLNNDSQKTELIAELSKFAYKIVKEQFLNKSGRKKISKFIHSKENDLTVVVIPYLKRKQNLLDLLVNLHPFLQRQYLHYSILVIEQSNLFDNFNKGRLYNTAFEHLAQNYPSKDAKLIVRCLIFQDVDLIPESDFNIYGCGDEKMPRHLSLSIRKSISVHKPKDNYTHNLYELLVGGVLSITPNVFSKINGFSNEFWNWGGEDDDFAIRMLVNNVCVTRPKDEHALYKMSYHKPSKKNPSRNSLLFSSVKRLENDGLSNFDKLNIKIIEEIKHNIFTSLLVNVGRILDHDSKSIFLSTSRTQLDYLKNNIYCFCLPITFRCSNFLLKI